MQMLLQRYQTVSSDPVTHPLQENCVYETVVLPLDERDFEKTVTPIVQEYFEHGDTNEVAVSFLPTSTGYAERQELTGGCMFIAYHC